MSNAAAMVESYEIGKQATAIFTNVYAGYHLELIDNSSAGW
jgi:hypothetical protein